MAPTNARGFEAERSRARRGPAAARSSSVGLALLLFVTVLGSAASTRAQEQPLQAANGAAIYLGSLEGILAVGIPIGLGLALANDAELGEGLLCVAVFPLCAVFMPSVARDAFSAVLAALFGVALVLVTPIALGGVGGAEGWDVDGSVLITSGMHGLSAAGLFGAGLGAVSDGSPELGGVLAGVLGSALSVTYAALRLDALARDPRLGVEANLLMWAPASAMLVTALFAALLDLDSDVAMVVVGSMGMLAQGAAITLAEVALATP